MTLLVHTAPSSIQPTTPFAVHLTSFKVTGTYYSSGHYRSFQETLSDIFCEVDEMVQLG